MNLRNISSIFSSYQAQERFVLVDSHLLLLYPDLENELRYLAPGGLLAIAGNEMAKNIESISQIWRFLLSHNATRHSMLICVGGGVISDMGGFVAATYKRGIVYANVPTTLLAMVDASVGGKTAIDFSDEKGIIYKNSVGLFYPPIDTILLPDWLKTLPMNEFLSGYAELIKTTLLDDEVQFKRALSCLESYIHCSDNASEVFMLAEHAASVKQAIVSQDPTERGPRKALNLGHTIGHALEAMSLSEGQPMAHGYAVMYGLIGALYLSVTRLGMDRQPLQRLTAIMLQYYGRPQCTCRDTERLLELMRNDKKNSLDKTGKPQINFTLLSQIGDPFVDQFVPDNEIIEAIEYINSL